MLNSSCTQATGLAWLLWAGTAGQPPRLLHTELYERHVPSGTGMKPSRVRKCQCQCCSTPLPQSFGNVCLMTIFGDVIVGFCSGMQQFVCQASFQSLPLTFTCVSHTGIFLPIHSPSFCGCRFCSVFWLQGFLSSAAWIPTSHCASRTLFHSWYPASWKWPLYRMSFRAATGVGAALWSCTPQYDLSSLRLEFSEVLHISVLTAVPCK